MNIPAGVEILFHRVVDTVFACLPQRTPSRGQLRRCRIVSHRGEHDNRRVMENTVAALDRAVAAGVWGIEFDVRWTRDLQPVVFHDVDLQRLFSCQQSLREFGLKELQRRFPLIPTLAEVLERYRGRVHLMIEIKAEPYPDPEQQNQILQHLLADWVPQQDFHLMSLNPEMFDLIDGIPAAACVPIALIDPRHMSRLALKQRYRGVAGHYLFITRRLIRRHHARRQAVGTGFAASRRSLFREIHRGVDWVFSNRAARMQRICRQG
jgi:glycerophosphoryl diester phosphodiesterase